MRIGLRSVIFGSTVVLVIGSGDDEEDESEVVIDEPWFE